MILCSMGVCNSNWLFVRLQHSSTYLILCDKFFSHLWKIIL